MASPFVQTRKPKVPRKSPRTGRIAGGVAIAATPFVASSTTASKNAPKTDAAGREPVAAPGVSNNRQAAMMLYPGADEYGVDATGAAISVEPVAPQPGASAAGNSGGKGGPSFAEGGGLPGLGLSFDQLAGIYDRVEQRRQSPTPTAPGASTGRATRPEPTPSPAQTPKPAAPTSAVKMIAAALLGLVVGFLLFKWVGALLGAILFVVLAKFFL